MEKRTSIRRVDSIILQIFLTQIRLLSLIKKNIFDLGKHKQRYSQIKFHNDMILDAKIQVSDDKLTYD